MGRAREQYETKQTCDCWTITEPSTQELLWKDENPHISNKDDSQMRTRVCKTQCIFGRRKTKRHLFSLGLHVHVVYVTDCLRTKKRSKVSIGCVSFSSYDWSKIRKTLDTRWNASAGRHDAFLVKSSRPEFLSHNPVRQTLLTMKSPKSLLMEHFN